MEDLKYNKIPLGVVGKPQLTSKLKKKALAQILKAYITKGEPQLNLSPINLPGGIIPKTPVEEVAPTLGPVPPQTTSNHLLEILMRQNQLEE